MKKATETRMNEMGEKLRRLQEAVSRISEDKQRLRREAWLAENRISRLQALLGQKEADIRGYRELLEIQDAAIAVLMERLGASLSGQARGRVRLAPAALAAHLGKKSHTAWKDVKTGEIVIELNHSGVGPEGAQEGGQDGEEKE